VPAAKDKSPLATTGAQDDTDIAITAYMARVGQASPRDLQQTFALSKATIFRRLRRLELTGTVARSGRTTARRYHLVSYNNAKQRSCTEIKAN
jgi:DNA-binding MarR family transcriptional regulator